jgi:hypothetical protein
MDHTHDFLRDKAKQCRDFARYHNGASARQLMTMADELEAQAEALERIVAGLLAVPMPPPRRPATPAH